MKLSKTQQKEYEALRTTLEETLNAFIEARSAFMDFRDGIVEEFQGKIDDKSEKWQEGDAGQAAATFVQSWEEDPCEEIGEDIAEYPLESE